MKFKTPGTIPTGQMRELLICLSEELAELGFAWDPLLDSKSRGQRAEVVKYKAKFVQELGDVIEVARQIWMHPDCPGNRFGGHPVIMFVDDPMTDEFGGLLSFHQHLTFVQIRISKALRFGLDEVEDIQDLTNSERILVSLSRLLTNLELNTWGIEVSRTDEDVVAAAAKKEHRLAKWLQSQENDVGRTDYTDDWGDTVAWGCKIGARIKGGRSAVDLRGSDNLLRQAVEDVFERVTGYRAEFNLTGWGEEITMVERHVIDNATHHVNQD